MKWLLLLLFVISPAFADTVIFPPGSSGSGYLLPNPNYVVLAGACDGVTDDQVAFVAANAKLASTGGTILVPATGHGCASSAFTLSANVSLVGTGLSIYPGPGSTTAQWAARGSWIIPLDTINPAVTMSGPGSTISSINFIYNQPQPPSSGSWTPTIFPYTILATPGNFDAINNVSIVAASHCIDVEGPSNGVAGIGLTLDHIRFIGCFNRGTRFHLVDNTVHMNDLRYDDYWNQGNVPVINYIETHKVDWDMQYVANPQATNIEFYQSWKSILVTNDTVVSGFGPVTLGMANLQGANISFNEVCQAIVPATPNAIFTGTISGVIVAGDTGTLCYNAPKYMFDMSGNSGELTFNGMQVGFVQTLADVGISTLRINGLDVQSYSSGGTTGAPLFAISSGSILCISGTSINTLRPASGAGAVFGPGLDSTFGTPCPVQSGATGQGYTQLDNSGGTTYTGQVSFFDSSGNRQGYVGRGSATNPTVLSSDRSGITISAGGTGANGNITLNPGASGGTIIAGASSGVACGGAPSASFATVLGIVTHC